MMVAIAPGYHYNLLPGLYGAIKIKKEGGF